MPADADSRLSTKTTPRFARTVMSKYVQSSALVASTDLRENHGVAISTGTIWALSNSVAGTMIEGEKQWAYSTDNKVAGETEHIAIGMDGAYAHIRNDGYREAMCGTVSYYDREGKRLHTNYLGCSPEYCKEKFREMMEKEIQNVKKRFPDALYIGVADGARDNWTFLGKHADKCIVDFYHATTYLASFAEALPQGGKEWLEGACHRLKHTKGGAATVLQEMKEKLPTIKRKQKKTEAKKAVTYFTNKEGMMDYAGQLEEGLPIGSGVTEAGCKRLVKQRFCQSGMRWSKEGMDKMLTARALYLSEGRWQEFWQYYGKAAA